MEKLCIGARLKAARRLRRITLAELSAATDISISLLSRIENDKALPSLESLFAIASAMDIDVATFLTFENPGEFLIEKDSRQTMTVQNGKVEVKVEVLTSGDENALLEAFLLTLPPLATGGPLIAHEGEEMGYVVKGELEITVNDTTFVAKCGDTFHYPSHFDHTYRNASDDEAMVIWVNTPPPTTSRLRNIPAEGAEEEAVKPQRAGRGKQAK